MLMIGLLLWALTHLLVALAPEARQGLITRIGIGPYKGLFSLILVAALVLIVMGWKATPVEFLYVPPAWTRHLTMLLMPIAVILFLSPRLPTDIKQIIRHPQLTGVKLWAVAHLLSNGESRSVILFTGLLAWAVMEVIFINRRDGAWKKPAPVGGLKTTMSALFGIVATAAVMFAHPWIAGVALMGRG